MKNTEDFVEVITDLWESKKLLDKILGYYDVYSKQFEEISTKRYPMINSESLMTSDADELNKKIRAYLRFDDSE